MDFENKIVVVFCYEEYKDRVIKLKVEYKFFFEKMMLVKELSDEDLKRVYDEMIRIFNDEFKLNIVFKDGVMYDVVLIELKIYEGFEKCYFFIFSEVLDEYFGKIMFEKVKIE